MLCWRQTSADETKQKKDLTGVCARFTTRAEKKTLRWSWIYNECEFEFGRIRKGLVDPDTWEPFTTAWKYWVYKGIILIKCIKRYNCHLGALRSGGARQGPPIFFLYLEQNYSEVVHVIFLTGRLHKKCRIDLCHPFREI